MRRTIKALMVGVSAAALLAFVAPSAGAYARVASAAEASSTVRTATPP